MARCLIVGCGCRGRGLARQLLEHGHAVRGTTRRPEHLDQIADADVEPILADPDRIATLAPALEHVTLLCLLLGSASGTVESLEALHGERLEMLLSRVLDTTVRGVLYETAGTVPDELLEAGAGVVRGTCERSRIPYALLDADPGDGAEWLAATDAAARRLLAGGTLTSGQNR